MTKPGDKSKEMQISVKTDKKYEKIDDHVKIKDDQERKATKLSVGETQAIINNPNTEHLGEILFLGDSPG